MIYETRHKTTTLLNKGAAIEGLIQTKYIRWLVRLCEIYIVYVALSVHAPKFKFKCTYQRKRMRKDLFAPLLHEYTQKFLCYKTYLVALGIISKQRRSYMQNQGNELSKNICNRLWINFLNFVLNKCERFVSVSLSVSLSLSLSLSLSTRDS